MADDLINALQQSNRSASVLQGIANPAQINPLAAITAGNQAAQSEFQTREWQAKQAAGQAYQGAINPKTGEFDPNKFRTLLSQSGPAALQAGAALQNTQNISSDELNQQKLKLEQYNSSLGSLMAMGDNVTHADVVSKIQSLMAHKMMTLPEAQRIMSTIPAGQAELAGWVKQHALTMADASTRFNQTIGTRQTFSTPGATYNAPVPPPGMGQPTMAIPHGPGPGETQAGGIWVDAKGAEVPEGTPGAVWQEGVRPKTKMPQFQQGGPPTFLPGSGPSITPPPPVPPGTIYNVPGRGNQIAPIFDPVTGQRLTPTTTPPPMPPGARPDGPGRRSALEGGAPVASANLLQVPETGAPGAPMPMTASNVADIQAGIAQARANPRPEGTQTASDTRSSFIPTAPPQGQQKEVEASVQHASDARGRTLTYQRDIQPIEGAITGLAGADTGRASETLNSIRANIQDLTPGFLQRMLPHSLTDPEARKSFEEANKYLEQIKLAAPGGSRSDAGNASAGAATPSVHISNAAAREVALAILAQRRMEHAGTMLFNQSGKPGAAFDRHMGEWMTQIDPRAFVTDRMKPEERAAYVKSIGGPSTPDKPNPAYEQYKKSYQDAVASGVIRH